MGHLKGHGKGDTAAELGLTLLRTARYTLLYIYDFIIV